MNAPNPRPPGEQLDDDPLFHSTHFVVLDFEGTTPKGAPPEPIEVAALGLKYGRGRGPLPTGFSFTSFIHPPAHAPITPFDTAQTGITPRDVAQAPPAAVVLSGLEGALPEPPLLLVAHHAPTEGSILYAYRTACPRMAHTRIIDTLLLAKHVAPGLPSYSLDALLDHFGIPQPAHRHRDAPAHPAGRGGIRPKNQQRRPPRPYRKPTSEGHPAHPARTALTRPPATAPTPVRPISPAVRPGSNASSAIRPPGPQAAPPHATGRCNRHAPHFLLPWGFHPV